MNLDRRIARAQSHLQEGIETSKRTMKSCLDDVVAAADLIAAAFQDGNRLFICGNGGSAADSQHLAAEFTNRLTAGYVRPGLPALALTTDSSFLTACSNDFDFLDVFSRQLQSLGSAGDVVLGISTSGNSENVVRAFEYADEIGMKTISLTGLHGKLTDMAGLGIKVPSDVPAVIQETHLAIEHIICHLVERELFGYEEERT